MLHLELRHDGRVSGILDGVDEVHGDGVFTVGIAVDGRDDQTEVRLDHRFVLRGRFEPDGPPISWVNADLQIKKNLSSCLYLSFR